MLAYGVDYMIYTMQFLRESLFLSLIYRLLTFVTKTIQANNEDYTTSMVITYHNQLAENNICYYFKT